MLYSVYRICQNDLVMLLMYYTETPKSLESILNQVSHREVILKLIKKCILYNVLAC